MGNAIGYIGNWWRAVQETFDEFAGCIDLARTIGNAGERGGNGRAGQRARSGQTEEAAQSPFKILVPKRMGTETLTLEQSSCPLVPKLCLGTSIAGNSVSRPLGHAGNRVSRRTVPKRSLGTRLSTEQDRTFGFRDPFALSFRTSNDFLTIGHPVCMPQSKSISIRY